MAYLPLSPPLIVTGTSFTRPANTTQYAFGQLIANSGTAGSVVAPSTGNLARAVNQTGVILRVRLLKSTNSLTNANFRIHLYNQTPTATNGDLGTWLTTNAGYQGSLDVTSTQAFSDPFAEGIGVPTTGYGINFTPMSGAQNLVYLIEARNTYTPGSAEIFQPIFEVQ